jgi:voltage-gated potassium channel Kch
VNAVLTLFAIFTAVIAIGSIAIYIVEEPVDSQINSPLDAIWWTVATVTTVGYGQIIPETLLGRIIGILYMFFGVTLIAVSISIAGTRIYRKRFLQDEKMAREQETILELIKKLETAENEMKKELKEIKDSLNQNKK